MGIGQGSFPAQDQISVAVPQGNGVVSATNHPPSRRAIPNSDMLPESYGNPIGIAGIEAGEVAVGIGALAGTAAEAERPARNPIPQRRDLRMNRRSDQAKYGE